MIEIPDVGKAPDCGPRPTVTPGVVSANSRKLRWLMGRFRIFASPTVLESSVDDLSMRAVSAVTRTASATLEGSRRSSRVVVAPTDRRTFGANAARKPGREAETRYSPGGISRIAKEPPASEAAWREKPVS